MDSQTPKSETSTSNYASFLSRFLAYYIDMVLLSIVGLFLQFVTGQSVLDVFNFTTAEELAAWSESSSLLSTFIGLGLWVFYSIAFWVHYDGATPGKKLLGIRVTRDSGDAIAYPSGFVRIFGYIVSSMTLLFFGIGYLMIIWDSKKQALHDKIAGTVVVKTSEKTPRVGIVIGIIAIVLNLLYASIFMGKVFSLVFSEFDSASSQRSPITEQVVKERVSESREADKDRILSYAPSVCDVSVPVPKTTDVHDGSERKWLYEEVEDLNPETLVGLNEDVFSITTYDGSFIGYKDADSRLGGVGKFNIAYPGLNIYCIPNVKSLTLEEYASLALTNKDYDVFRDEMTYFGEIPIVPLRFTETLPSGEEVPSHFYISTTPDDDQLLYIKIWGAPSDDPLFSTITEDINIIIRNLQYRGSDASVRGFRTQGTYKLDTPLHETSMSSTTSN